MGSGARYAGCVHRRLTERVAGEQMPRRTLGPPRDSPCYENEQDVTESLVRPVTIRTADVHHLAPMPRAMRGIARSRRSSMPSPNLCLISHDGATTHRPGPHSFRISRPSSPSLTGRLAERNLRSRIPVPLRLIWYPASFCDQHANSGSAALLHRFRVGIRPAHRSPRSKGMRRPCHLVDRTRRSPRCRSTGCWVRNRSVLH